MDTKTNGAWPLGADEMRFMAAARSGDASQFALSTERFRRELHVHCYRMLASYEDAQDMTQETFLRAWNHRNTFAGRSSLRTWLYRIATHCCLDFLDKRNNRTPIPVEIHEGTTEVRYLQPFPDRLLPDDPQESAVARETIELAFIVAVQHLPPRQRAVLILRDVLGWQASHTADTLDLTVASVNSALQRARSTMRERLSDARVDWRASSTHELSADERALVTAYIDAHEQLDITKLTALLREDLKFAMPPEPGVWVGRDAAVDLWVEGGFGKPGFDDWRGVATTANRQPAVAMYVRHPDTAEYRALAIDVLRVVDGLVAEIYTYGDEHFELFGLPKVLVDTPRD